MNHRIKPLNIPDGPFVAIDFETADRGSDSACAIGMARVEGSEIVARKVMLLRPPRQYFTFTYIHGITWSDVKDSPTFAEAWPELRRFMEGAHFLAAHNAMFDRRVLECCCLQASLDVPQTPFLCTLHLSRKTWRLRSNKLNDVCAHLGVALRHHDAGSDADACAQIVIAAKRHVSQMASAVPYAEPEIDAIHAISTRGPL
ncbi:MAG TPA: 3'-5' exonuclease [Gemmataceae bacterium]|nr:3'-5' exonuclease [Gemmataceae bacterium]